METENSKAIGNWLSEIDGETLCLPRFQRKDVWKWKEVKKFLKTLLLETETPVGVFLVLSCDPSKSTFHPRMMDGSVSKFKTCNSLLLDGQQRLLTLWKTVCDRDEKYRYYIKFDDKFNVEDIIRVRKFTPTEEKRRQNPDKQYKKKWFPIELLNPLSDMKEVNEWLNSLELENHNPIKELIVKSRKIFSKRKSGGKGGKVIPYFLLSSDTERKTAIEIYEAINTNLVKLSFHYLAVAQMEKVTKKSLYVMADKLVKRVRSIDCLETDEIGELILKISCVLQGIDPVGGNYKSLDFKRVCRDETKIFDGIEWAVEKLKELQIWQGKQLPSVVPLRVLPALHQHVPKSGQSKANANRIIKKYLWHAFLTDRYEMHVSGRLREDYKDLKKYFESKITENEIKIFKEHGSPSKDEIRSENWPKTTNRLPRAILLVCCLEGAKTLSSDESLTAERYKKRTKHHIFPESRFSGRVNNLANNVLNCLLIPKEDNEEYGDDLPGDYIKKISNSLGMSLLQAEAEVKKRFETHLICRQSYQELVKVTQAAISNRLINLQDAYERFIDTRADDVKEKIKELLR